ncbi:hypothetical protein, partial [Caulobacter sp. 17J65-9]|uniref:hypothetical protein n=1 Tax=Caulobacter sp. 17J65-9 TaxID=2709382 RepID=UPI0013CDB021
PRPCARPAPPPTWPWRSCPAASACENCCGPPAGATRAIRPPNPATSTSTGGAFDLPLERLLEIIAAHAGPDGTWEFSYQTLADGGKADPRQIEIALAELERRGVIKVERCVVTLLREPGD